MSDDAKRFIQLLTNGPEDLPLFRTFHDRRRDQAGHNYNGTFDQCFPMMQADQMIGYGVFVVVNAGGHKDADITHYRAAFIDIDIYNGQLAPQAWHLAPHIITERRNAAGALQAMHAYWLLQPSAMLADWTHAQRQLAAYYQSDSSVWNPSRVMRLPGTFHLKDEPTVYSIAWPRADAAKPVPLALHELTKDLPQVDEAAYSPVAARGEVTLETDDPVTQNRIIQYLQGAEPAIEGDSGDKHTFAVAAHCREQGLSLQTTLDLMCEHWNDRCEPPWPYDELAQKVGNAYTYAQQPQGSANAMALFAPNAGTEPGEILGEAVRTGNTASYDKNHAVNATQFIASQYPGGTLVRVQEDFYHFTGRAWEALEDNTIKHQLTLAMLGSNPADSTINGTFGLLWKLCHRSDLTLGTWRGRWGGAYVIYQNGILDLTSGELEKHTLDYFSTALLPYDYTPEAAAPRWQQFVNEIFNEDQECIALLQEWLGYMLLPDYTYQKALLLLGRSRSGKGTIGRILEQLVGTQNYGGMTLEGFSIDAMLESIIDTPVLFIGDAHSVSGPNRNATLDRIKSITGEDQIPITRKYKGTWRGRLPGRITMSANNVPNFIDDSGALASRFMVLPFNQSWLGRESVTLGAELAAEIEGINAWALLGLRRLQSAKRFTLPAASIDEQRELDIRYSPLKVFVEDCCKLGEGLEFRVHTSDLYDAYRAWALVTGQRSTHRNGFASAIRSAYRGEIYKDVVSINNKRAQGFCGIKLRTAQPAAGVEGSNIFHLADMAAKNETEKS